MRKSVALLVGVLAAAVPSGAAAQQQQQQRQILDGKLAITVSVGIQPGSQNADRTETFPLYGEEARIDIAQDIDGGAFFDIGASYKVGTSIGVGFAYSRFSSGSDAALGAQIPHPSVTNRFRSFTASVSGLDHTESAVHLNGIWFVPFTDKIDFSFAIGPSFFSVTQGFPRSITASDIAAREVAPFNSLTIDRVDAVTLKESGAGFNLGADASYAFTPLLSGVVMLRYSRASVDFTLGNGQTASVDVGNAQIGAGVRVRF
jgi:hypothetical protein